TPDIEFDDFPILMVVPKSERVVQSQTLIEESPGAFMMFADCAKSLKKTLLFVEQFGYPHIAVLGPDPVDRLGRRLSVTRLPLGNFSVDQFSIEADEMAKIVQLWEEAKLNGSYWDLLYDLNEHERETTRKEDDAIRANLRENRADRAQPPQFSITPRSLEDALWLQFKIAVSDNTQLQQCTECPTWFAYGTGTGRRKSALYCSPKCSKTAYRRRKAESQ
ncbi:MAG: hypothetical protein O7A66_01020, partial [Alphaproteobacteria bacterium]|nr:hypothetical protein [Alphaproteobacteria bacterium]